MFLVIFRWNIKSISFGNEGLILSIGNYFFNDVIKEGIVLYNRGIFTLKESRELTPAEAQQKAQDYYDQWFTSANKFLKIYHFSFNEEDYYEVAFLLHQATEYFYTTIFWFLQITAPKSTI